MTTKYHSEKNKFDRQDKDTPISIGSEEVYAESRPPYICDMCHQTLIKLQDRSGLSISWYCNNCKSEYDPEEELGLRSESEIVTAQGPAEEVGVSYAPTKELTRKKNEQRGTFKVLRDRGLNITKYEERGWRRENEDD